MENLQNAIKEIARALEVVPKHWDGREAILELKESDYKWRENEWIGWYFQYWCEKNLANIGMRVPGNKFGRSEFDGFLVVDWDFKAHALFDRNGKPANIIPANDEEATLATIDRNGTTGLIVAQGKATFDEDGKFREWHKALKGESAYSLANRARGVRQRVYKTAFSLDRIDIFLLNHSNVDLLGSFQSGMRNSNGNPRRAKMSIDLSKLDPEFSILF